MDASAVRGHHADGVHWGRGTIERKSVVLHALVTIELARSGARPPRDVIFAAVADEERGGRLGAGWLVDHRPELVRAEYALGEIGGIGRTILGRRRDLDGASGLHHLSFEVIWNDRAGRRRRVSLERLIHAH